MPWNLPCRKYPRVSFHLTAHLEEFDCNSFCFQLKDFLKSTLVLLLQLFISVYLDFVRHRGAVDFFKANANLMSESVIKQVFFPLLNSNIAPCSIDVEPVGRWFRAWWHHHNHRNGALSGEGHSFAESLDTVSDEEAECSTVEIEDDVVYLRSLDPKEWKVANFFSLSLPSPPIHPFAARPLHLRPFCLFIHSENLITKLLLLPFLPF